jgi:hypothetical protein
MNSATRDTRRVECNVCESKKEQLAEAVLGARLSIAQQPRIRSVPGSGAAGGAVNAESNLLDNGKARNRIRPSQHRSELLG